MDGFFTYLIILGVAALYSVLLIVVYKHFFIDSKEPDAILFFEEIDDKVKANFMVLLPIDDMRKREHIRVEIRNKKYSDEMLYSPEDDLNDFLDNWAKEMHESESQEKHPV